MNSLEPWNRAELLKAAYRTVSDLKAQLAAAEDRRSEPVAIVGMACRMPRGAATPDEFWQMLIDGVDGIGEIPADRWDIDDFYDPDPDAPNKMYVRQGGFIDGFREFDPQFFRVPPAEAAGMDPQLRMLLETAWEAIENAGWAPDALTGTRTGVFVGSSSNDFGHLMAMAMRHDGTQMQMAATGMSPSIKAGYPSYFLGLQGPSVALDTSCSSGLTAVHMACESLRRAEASAALAGAVNLILMPESSVVVCKARMLSPDGHCKTFDASANGYVRSEGCGFVVLKLLSKAQADGDRVIAVIRGSAWNQDGRTNGITAPSGNAQREVIEAALAAARVRPGEIGYVETHGTGTSLGDPIEVQALGEALGQGRPAGSKVVLGAVKSNIGHLECAAGIAGIIKAAYVVQKGVIPPNLHFNDPNPHTPWASLPFVVPTRPMAWPEGDTSRKAGLSSFGFSGTNVHMILEEPPAPVPRPAVADAGAYLLPLSGKTAKARTDLARRYLDWFDRTPDADLGDVCFTAAVGRAHFAHRLAIVADGPAAMRATLADYLAAPERVGGWTLGIAPSRAPKLGFVIGGVPEDMAATLAMHAPAYRQAFDACEAAAAALGLSLSGSDRTAAFARAYAAASAWLAWGLAPAAVSGTGAAILAAAAVAGAVGVGDALLLTRDADAAIVWTGPAMTLLSPLDGEALTIDGLREIHRAERPQAPAALAGGLAREGAKLVVSLGAGGFAASPALAAITVDRMDWAGVLDAAGRLYVAGIALDRAGMEAPWGRRRVSLPTYPFQRQDCGPDLISHYRANAAAPAPRAHAQRGTDARQLGSWLYEPSWRRLSGPAPVARGDGQRWLIVGEDGALADALARRLRRAGATPTLARPADHDALLREAGADGGLDGIAYLADGSSRTDGNDAARVRTAELLDFAQALQRGGVARLANLALVTRGFRNPSLADADTLAAGTAWGFGRVLAGERPELNCRLYDLDPADATDIAADRLAAELLGPSAENQIALAGDERFGLRLIATDAAGEPTQVNAEPLDLGTGSYLVTGAFSGIGLITARWLAEQGAKSLILLGRGAPTAEARAAIDAITAKGVAVRAEQVDVGDRTQLQALLAASVSPASPLRGVIHSAGTIDDGIIAGQDHERFAGVLRPKIDGGWLLHELTREWPLQFFVLFSAGAGLFGNPGQSSYAAASVFMDQLALARRGAGLPALSIDWGPWTEVGMAARMDRSHAESWDAQGLGGIAPADGMAVLAMLLRGRQGQVAVLPLDRAKLAKSMDRVPPFLAELAGVPAGAAAPPAPPPTPVASELPAPAAPPLIAPAPTAAEPEEPLHDRDYIERYLLELWRDLLGAQDISVDDDYFDLGGHSLLTARMIAQLERTYNRTLSAALIIQAPTIRQLADAIENMPPLEPGPSLFLFRSGDESPPLIMMPSLAGTIMPWRQFVRDFRSPRACAGVYIAGEPDYDVPTTFEQVSELCARRIMAAFPDRMCHIIGYSFGGALAFEVARQLRELGHPVGITVLVDQGPKQAMSWRMAWPATKNFFVRAREALLRGGTIEQKMNTLRWSLQMLNKRRHGRDAMMQEYILGSGERVETNYRMVAWFTNLKLRYEQKSYDGDLLLIRADKRAMTGPFGRDLGWSDFVRGRIEVERMPGDHNNVLSTDRRFRVIDVLDQHLPNFDGPRADS